MKPFPALWASLLVVVSAPAAYAATLCVGAQSSGTGDGSSWNNLKAWDDTPVRGDTWYLADGDYSGKTLDAPASGSSVITIKKATLTDHGPSDGWTDSLGDGQASFGSAILFKSSHWIFDGQTGGGPSGWDQGFGFKITSTDDAMAMVRIGYDNQADDISVRHVDLEGKGSVSDQGGGYSNDAVAIYGSSNITLSYAWIHGAGRCPFFIDTADSVFEYVYVQSYFGSSAVHSEVASIWSFGGLNIGDITFRHNLITHVISTGGLMFDNSSNPSSHLYVYGNVFYKPPGAQWEQANGLIGGWTGGNGEEMHNVWVDNNTFVNIDQSSLSTLPNVTSGSRAQNNLWVDSDAPSFDLFPTHDYNHFVNSGDAQGEASGTSAASGNPFTDSAALDFTLTANTEPGLDLGAPYNVDAFGHARTTWTRGAYELCEGAACFPAPDAGVGGSATGGAGTGGSTTGGTGAGGSPTGGTNAGGSSAKNDAGDEGGCGCTTAARSSTRTLFGAAGLLFFAWARRRRPEDL